MSHIDSGLLKILCCPETHQGLSEVDAAAVADLNERVTAGTLKNRAGRLVEEKLDGALIRSDRKVIYLIRNRIPIMLIEEAVLL